MVIILSYAGFHRLTIFDAGSPRSKNGYLSQRVSMVFNTDPAVKNKAIAIIDGQAMSPTIRTIYGAEQSAEQAKTTIPDNQSENLSGISNRGTTSFA